MSDWTVRGIRFEPKRGRGMYRVLEITSPSGHKFELTESPTGRSVHVHVDGKRYVEVDG